MKIRDNACDRIKRIRAKYHHEVPIISVERARYYTESWRATDGQDLPLEVRVAQAMKNVFEKMTIFIDDDDLLAGHWTEAILGQPIDIERGNFNRVLETELYFSSILGHNLRSGINMVKYAIGKRKIGQIRHNMKIWNKAGPNPIAIGYTTMDKRKQYPFTITAAEKKLLMDDLLPYWRDRCLVDKLEQELIESDIFEEDLSEFRQAMPANTSRAAILLNTCAAIGSFQGHLIVDYEIAIKRGLLALQEEVRAAAKAANLTDEQSAYLRAVDIALDGVMIFSRRLADRLADLSSQTTDAERKSQLETMAANCRRVPAQPARSFYEAIQCAWTVKTALELAHPANVHSCGRLDRYLLPYYEADIASGAIAREFAGELIQEYLLKAMAHNMRLESNLLMNFYQRFEGSEPVTVGGRNADGSSAVSDLTYLVIEAAEKSKSVISVVVRADADSPDELFLAVADVLYHGTSNLSINNDDICIEALKRRGIPEADANNYAITGCVDYIVPGKTGGWSINAMMVNRLLDVTLRNGSAMTMLGAIPNMGLQLPQAPVFPSFEVLLESFLAQVSYTTSKIVAASDLRDRLYAEMSPSPYLSALIEGCTQNKKDVTRGGALYDLTSINYINSVANLIDSLYVIKKLVYDERKFSLAELLASLDDNFEGHDEIRRAIDDVQGKWGNGNAECDALGNEILSRMFAETEKYRTYRDAPLCPIVISMTTHTMDGRLSPATPDGRPAAVPFAASCNPYNVEKNGATGVLRSLAALPNELIMGSACNIRLHPSAIGDSIATRKKWVALLRTYFKIGGVQLQPTVVSAEILRAAQEEPEKYRDLMVKVGGYSSYFVDLGREIQAEVIARTEHA